MGNGLGTLGPCFSVDAPMVRPPFVAGGTVEPTEDNFGHSFVYVHRDGAATHHLPISASSISHSSHVHHSEEGSSTATAPTDSTFWGISGAAISANSATPLSTAPILQRNELACSSSTSFESSSSFASVALQLGPRYSGSFSGPLSDRGFASGHLDQSFHSGPLDSYRSGGGGGLIFSGPLERPSFSSSSVGHYHHSLSQRLAIRLAARSQRRSRLAIFRSFTKTISRAAAKIRSIATSQRDPEKKTAFTDRTTTDPTLSYADSNGNANGRSNSGEESDSLDRQGSNVQWAQAKAGEDRAQVVISEEHGWVFVGIYDGFNGPDATDYLLNNLYSAIHRELKGLLWDDKLSSEDDSSQEFVNELCCEVGKLRPDARNAIKKRKNGMESDIERSELEKRLQDNFTRPIAESSPDHHKEVLKALSRALRRTEEAFLDLTDKMVSPELALMGSCVLVVLMKGPHLYLMNVGDSRAVLARQPESDLWNLVDKATQDLDVIRDEASRYLESDLVALQLTVDHSTSNEEEVRRIRIEHPDDPNAIVNNRVKGLKVTRAFGAGYLKQPKWNNALLPTFKVDYKGASSYITCDPYLYQHLRAPKDKYLILSSDGLYQYMSNEEVVAQVELYISMYPDGDPAQYLVEEVLNRAAKEAGMEVEQLLEIPQGDRRKYHDDVSVLVISWEGRLWKSCV